MKFLVTGITGFAGPHLANHLIREGHEVYGLIRGSNGMETDILDVVSSADFSKIKFVYSDLTNFRRLGNIFKENIFDGVFHLAAQSHPPTSFIDPIGTFETNVNGSLNLIQCISDLQPECKLMFCSTSEVYGNIGSDKHTLKVTDRILPANPYGASKAAIDIYLQERFASKKINGFITRAFSHTGPRRGKTFSISSDAFQIANMMLGHSKDHVLLIGNLKTIRVVLDVRDIVNAYYLLMMDERSSGKVFNVSGEVPHEMQYYTDLLIKQSGLKDIEQKIYEKFWRPIDISYQCGDCIDLIGLTGWKPMIQIEDTMDDLLDYWVKKLL